LVTSLPATLNVTLESGIAYVDGITFINDATLPQNRRCKTDARFHCDPSFHRPTAFGQLAQPGPDREKASLAQFHNELRKYAHLHDTYIGVAPIGNEETVPLPLERLRPDFGASEPSHPSRTGMAFDCAQVHLIDVLREITNTDRGMFYPRWAAWWEKNHSLPQRQWMLEGFAAEGLHAVDLVNERFGLELIEQMGRNHDYHSFNAAPKTDSRDKCQLYFG
jgi:hypothetical protein